MPAEPRISDETLTGSLVDLANEWDEKRDQPGYKNNTIWWLNQESYLGGRFGIALIDDLLAARGLPPRSAGSSDAKDGEQ